jgi:hypothetical protein
MEYCWRPVGNQIVIDAAGDIDLYEKAKFSNWVMTTSPSWQGKKATAIVLNSAGGNVMGGDGLAGVVYQYGLNTGVAHGGVCASACVEVWAAGRMKSVSPDAKIGVHSIYADWTSPLAGSPVANANMAGMNAFMSAVYRKVGAPDNVINMMLSTPGTSVYWLTPDDLRSWNANVTF